MRRTLDYSLLHNCILGNLLLFALAISLALPAHGGVLWTLGPVNDPTTGHSLSASALFELANPTELKITLTNTSSHKFSDGEFVPADILSALFFNVADDPTLSYKSAYASGVVNGSDPGDLKVATTGGLSGGWQYLEGISGPGGTSYGPGTAGFGIFAGKLVKGPGTLNSDYGIINAHYAPGEGNRAVDGTPMAQDSIAFLFEVAPGFRLEDVRDVYFQYGTDLDREYGGPGTAPVVNTPEPGSLALFIGLGSIALARRRARKG